MQQSSDTYDGISMNLDGEPQKMTYKESDTRVFKDNTKSRMDTDDRRRVRIYRKLLRVQEFLEGSKAFTFGNLRKSGLLHMIKKFMIEDETSAYDTILNHREEIENQYSKIASVKKFVMVYGKYLED